MVPTRLKYIKMALKRKLTTTSNCCPICEEEYQEENFVPVILVSCGHTICRKCAMSLEKQSSISCPTCCKSTKSTAAALPKNFALCDALSTPPPTSSRRAESSSSSSQNSTKMEEAKEVISKLSAEELINVHKAIAEEKMAVLTAKIAREQEEFKFLEAQIEKKKGQVVQYVTQINSEIAPLHVSMQAKVTSIQSNVNSLTAICAEANAKILPNRRASMFSSNLLVAPNVVVPTMPLASFVAAPQFVVRRHKF